MSLSREAKKGYIFSAILFAVVIAALVLTGDKPTRVDNLLEVVPRNAMAVLHVPKVSDLGRQLETAAAGLGIERRTSAFRDNIARQVGFDPFNPAELSGKGLRPDTGLLLYSPPPGRSFVAVVQVRDRSTFEDTIMELLGARTGAERGEDREVGGTTIKVAEARGRAVAAWAYLGDAALISAGTDCIGRITAGALLEEGTIDEELWFRRAISAGGNGDHLFGWSSGAGVARVQPLVGGFLDAGSIGLRFTDHGLIARVWGGIDAPRRNAFDPFKVSLDATSLISRLDPEAMAAGRIFVDLGTAWSLARIAGLPRHVDEFSAQLIARGIRVDRDLLPLLEGIFVVDAGMIGEPNLDTLRRTDPRRLNPFLYAKTTVLAPIVDSEKASEFMPVIAEAVARAVRGRLEVIRIGGREAYEIHYHLGLGMTFGLAEGMLIVAGGEGAYEQALARLQADGGGLAASIDDERVVEALGKDGAMAALVHVSNLVSSVQGLPAESFGGGPTGMMIRSMVEMFIGPVSKLDRVMATISVDDHGVVGEIEVGYSPPEVAAR